MKIYGYTDCDPPIEEIVPDSLAEITLVASPSELRRIAEFLLKGAATMERMGSTYSHEHLSDCDHSFESSPHFVIAPPDVDAGTPHLSPIEKEALDSIVNDYESPTTIIAEISQALGRSVSESELVAALISLAACGLADAYVYDMALANYQPIAIAKVSPNTELWFLATAAGRATNAIDG